MIRFQISNYIQNARIISVFILLACCVCATCWGQLYPEPLPGYLAGQAINHYEAPEPGLLFYLSGENNVQADFAAGGQKNPNYLHGIKIIPGGAAGNAFEADNDQLLSYWAPGNIFAQRGTLSFFWRSRYPIGSTPFPIFRVGYADHTSWDMVWLRIDFNGAGFDAFVTDVGLARTRVSHYLEKFPDPEHWTHIAFSWDETEGVKLYINGRLVEEKSVTRKVFDTALDQFGPHSRIISPYQVQSAYNFVRGGDFDELRIYDRMLSDENIKALANGIVPDKVPELHRDVNKPKWRSEWWVRNGWNLPNDPPPLLTSKNVAIKKIGIHGVYDIKRWTWKASDGIRETTWPGVYNMSRLPGRYDYFVLPDWDCYSVSGQSVKFYLPNEPWNHVEIWGTAWGQLTVESEQEYDNTFAVRSQNQVKSYHRLNEPFTGGKIRFDNALIEEPIGELGVYNVQESKAPERVEREIFKLYSAPEKLQNESLQNVSSFIDGRFPSDERSKMLGYQSGSQPATARKVSPESLPLNHIMIPYTENPEFGLDGVEIELPPLSVTPTHNGVYPMNIRIKDPLWPMRDLTDFSFSVKPDSLHILWIDTRDLILPKNHALYITISGSGKDLTTEALEGTVVKLIYKPKEEALPQHEKDRFTQVRDLYSHVVEEHPSNPRLNLYNRLMADLNDLLKVNPNHWLGRTYQYAITRNPADRPEVTVPESPKNIPKWAFLQTEYLQRVEKIISYYIDNRQISNGEFGGGLSDDDDFTNMFVGSAFMGIEPKKIKKSLQLLNEGYYDQDRKPYDAPLRQRSLPLFTNGLSTIRADELHSYEEGIEAVGQLMILDYGNPLYFNRGMEIAKRLLDDITQIAPDGHRHFRTRYYSGTEMSTEDPWQWSQNYSYLVLQPAYLVARYNGNPSLRKMIVELADGLLAHSDKEGNLYTEINFSTGEARGQTGTGRAWPLFMAAYEFTGDEKYLTVVPEKMIRTREFNQNELVEFYTEQIKEKEVRQYIETKGSIWIDRINRDDPSIQKHRLGGVALVRANSIYPQNYVSWNIHEPDDYKSLAFFLPEADSAKIRIIAFNLEKHSVKSNMTAWNIKPGKWQITQGVDTDNDDYIDSEQTEKIVDLQNGETIGFTFSPEKYSIINLKLSEPAPAGYNDRMDLAIDDSGIQIEEDMVIVNIYNLGAIDSPETTLLLRDKDGKTVQKIIVPSIKAPLDLIPKWKEIKMKINKGTDLTSGSIEIDPDFSLTEITRNNNTVNW